MIPDNWCLSRYSVSDIKIYLKARTLELENVITWTSNWKHSQLCITTDYYPHNISVLYIYIYIFHLAERLTISALNHEGTNPVLELKFSVDVVLWVYGIYTTQSKDYTLVLYW